jgi:hypothetical protein
MRGIKIKLFGQTPQNCVMRCCIHFRITLLLKRCAVRSTCEIDIIPFSLSKDELVITRNDKGMGGIPFLVES